VVYVDADDRAVRTKIDFHAIGDFTRVGAVLGTPFHFAQGERI